MSTTRTQWTIGGVAALVVSLAGALAVFGVDVSGMLPMTRSAHAQDLAQVEQEHTLTNTELANLIREMGAKTDAFERAWRCDEISEEMLDIRREMATLDDRNQREAEAWLAAEQRLEQLAARWGIDGLNCAEFVD